MKLKYKIDVSQNSRLERLKPKRACGHGAWLLPIVLLGSAAMASAQVGTGGLAIFGDRVIKESIASTAPLVQVSGGSEFTVALRADGSVVAWGNDQYGQCDIPKDLLGVTQVATGKTHTLLLLADGTIRAFGFNNYGQNNIPAGLANVVQIAAGDYFSIALTGDGAIHIWGSYASGLMPPAGLNNVVQIAGGEDHLVALKADGSIVCWGQNTHNECASPSGNNFVSIAVAYEHSAAVRSDGTIACWGSNNYGESSPPAGLTGIVGVAVGQSHGIALKSDGSVVGWGANFSGEAAAQNSSLHLSKIFAGSAASYGLDAQGNLTAWGASTYGQTQVPVGLYDVAKVAAGWSHFLLLKHDGTLASWGRNTEGQGNVPSIPGIKFTDVSAGALHSICLGEAVPFKGLFGDNGWGQLAIPAGAGKIDRFWAVGSATYAHKVAGGVVAFGRGLEGELNLPNNVDYQQVVGGALHVVGLQPDGTIVGAGNNSYGQITFPAGLNGIKQIAAGNTDTFALKSDGTLLSWGLNNAGQTATPFGLSGVTQVAAGSDHGIALKYDGSVVTWGGNYYGQATPPPGMAGIAQVGAGTWYSVCLPRMTLSVGPYGVYGGDSAIGTVFLADPAPAGGTVVNLASSNSVAKTPTSVTVLAGQTSATFVVTTTNPVSTVQPIISATLGSATQESLLTVAYAPYVDSIAKSSIVGGSTMAESLTINLVNPAPVGGAKITFQSLSPALTTPSPYMIPQGQSTATISIPHWRVHTPTVAQMQFKCLNVVRSVGINVMPFQITGFTAVPTSIMGGTGLVASATINATPLSDIALNLTSSDTTSIATPALMTVKTNAATGSVALSSIDTGIDKLVNVTASLDGSSMSSQVDVEPALKGLDLDTSTTTYGATSVNCKITLTLPAPVGGLKVSLVGSNCQIPVATWVIGAGQTSSNFTVASNNVSLPTAMKVTATYGVEKLVASKTVQPNVLTSLVVSPTSFASSSTTVVTATVKIKAPVAYDTFVTIASSDPTHVSLPSTIKVAAGSSTGSVTITHTAVPKAESVNIAAAYAGAKQTVLLKVYP